MMRLPLRLRLVLGFAAGMFVVMAGLGAFLYLRVGSDLLNGIDMELRARAQVILGAIAGRSEPLVGAQGTLIDPDEAFAQVLDASGRIVDTSSAVARAPMLPAATLRSVVGATFLSTRVRGVDDPARLLVVPRGRGRARVYAVVGATLGDRNDALGRLLLELSIAGPVALLLVAAAGWALAGAALRPVERMRREAAAMSASEPERRLPVPTTGDELARLATTLNGLFDRLQEAMEREQRFVDEASHELRTPLGVLRMELDLALARARTPEEMAAALRNASAETDRLVRLAEDLLVLARAQGGTLPLHRRETPICELLGRAATAHETVAANARVAIAVECPEDLVATVDPERIRQGVDNLLDNALRHCPPGGSVTMSAARNDDRIAITVTDTGAGFPSEVLERGREPFSRGRAGSTGEGAGLGLSIVGAIAAAHGGTLRLENPAEGGARATLELRAERSREPAGRP
jgi:two-component system, OmpR family, sensor kinase